MRPSLAASLALLLIACDASSPPPGRAHSAPAVFSTAGPIPPTSASAEPLLGPAVTTDAKSADGNAFTLKMYGKIRPKPGNFFFSGTSLRGALGIAYLGARGDTAKEMASALDFDSDRMKVAETAKAEIAAWNQAGGGAELSVANRLWPDISFRIKSDFVAAATDAYGGSLEPVDFVNNAESSRKTINRWVAQKTKDKIPDLLPGGSLTPLTRLVITNALYFKGTWGKTFAKAYTKDTPFRVNAKTTTVTPMMSQTSEFKIAQTSGLKMLEMPYVMSDLVMDIVLPNDPAGLARVEETLSNETLARWVEALSHSRVAVTLPKFTFKWGGSVTAQLKELGMVKAFASTGADFTGVADPGPGGDLVYVSDVFHKTFVAVDELGTEAAAATGVVMTARSLATQPPVEFKADHPFFFLIRDTQSGRILFAGRMVDPKG
jgi:serpin B